MATYRYFIASLIILHVALCACAEDHVFRYHRNSLAVMMVYHEEDQFGYDIATAFDSIKISDKYNDHSIGLKFLDNQRIYLTNKKKPGLHKDEYGKVFTSSKIQKNAEEILNILNQAEYAKRMVEKWFNFTGKTLQDATFNTELIKERGQYNSSDLDIAFADMTIRQRALLSDAGEELIDHTYVLVNDITYVTAEERGEVAKIVLSIILAMMGMDSNSISNINSIVDSFTGFTVKVHSYLYQLNWNDEIGAYFYKNYYTEQPNPDKIKAFLEDNELFTLNYIGHAYECDTKTVYVGDYSRTELVKTVCARAIDKNMATLQKSYEPFRIKAPITSIEDSESGVLYNVNIGLKEGVSDKSTYKVILPYTDPQTDKTRYKKVATLQPINGRIWDNRYNAVYEVSEFSELSHTSFRKVSGEDIKEGMLVTEEFKESSKFNVEKSAKINNKKANSAKESVTSTSTNNDKPDVKEKKEYTMEERNNYYLAYLYKIQNLKENELTNDYNIKKIKQVSLENSVKELLEKSAGHDEKLNTLEKEKKEARQKTEITPEERNYYYLAYLYKTQNLKENELTNDYDIKRIKQVSLENSVKELLEKSAGYDEKLNTLEKEKKEAQQKTEITPEERNYYYLAYLYKIQNLKENELTNDYDIKRIKKVSLENSTKTLLEKSSEHDTKLDMYKIK